MRNKRWTSPHANLEHETVVERIVEVMEAQHALSIAQIHEYLLSHPEDGYVLAIFVNALQQQSEILPARFRNIN